MRLSVALIALNEELNIEACLETVKWADEIILVDSGSTDSTVAKAHAYTHKIFKHPFVNFADQKNFALSRATGDWVLFLDADERVTPELKTAIQAALARSEQAVYGMRRATYFFGKRLRFSGTRGDYPLRFFPRGQVRFEQPVHEHIVTELPVKQLSGILLHYSTRDFAHYKRKLFHYVSLELETMLRKKIQPSVWKLFYRPLAKFIQLYILQLGLLDGVAGLQYAALSSYYDFLKHKKYLSYWKHHAATSRAR